MHILCTLVRSSADPVVADIAQVSAYLLIIHNPADYDMAGNVPSERTNNIFRLISCQTRPIRIFFLNNSSLKREF